MEALNNTAELGTYNTAINIIGGLKDCNVIFKAIDSYFSKSDSLDSLINQRNEFNLRTERSRIRIEREIQKSFLKFKNKMHQELMQGIVNANIPQQDKQLILVWQFALNNRLFRELTLQVFIKTYFSGRASISKDDTLAYLKEFLYRNKALQINWSESTINILSSKYLNIMSKLGFLNQGRIKSFKHIIPSTEALVIFLYFAQVFSRNNTDILTNQFLPISFIPLIDVHDRLKKLAMKNFFNMTFNGIALNIELIHNYKEISNVLYSRSPAKIC